MKKFFDRFRRWLIKKLGGYTEQLPPIQREIGWTETIAIHPQKIQAQISVSPPFQGIQIDFKEYCESRVLELLVQELYQSGFIMWESHYEAFPQKVNVSAELYVVNESRPYSKSRVV